MGFPDVDDATKTKFGDTEMTVLLRKILAELRGIRECQRVSRAFSQLEQIAENTKPLTDKAARSRIQSRNKTVRRAK